MFWLLVRAAMVAMVVETEVVMVVQLEVELEALEVVVVELVLELQAEQCLQKCQEQTVGQRMVAFQALNTCLMLSQIRCVPATERCESHLRFGQCMC